MPGSVSLSPDHAAAPCALFTLNPHLQTSPAKVTKRVCIGIDPVPDQIGRRSESAATGSCIDLRKFNGVGFCHDGGVDEPLNVLGFEMRPGDRVEVGSTELFRDWLMPVIAIVDGELRVNGTAVCIGAGTFVTARHVVDYLLDDKPEDEDAEVWVAWDADGVNGHMMSVVTYRKHERVDLAILTTRVPPAAVDRLKSVPWEIRMPAPGELVIFVGYPNGRVWGDLTADGPTNVTLDHPLTISLGRVTEYFKDWQTELVDPWGELRPLNPRGWPGFGADAPMPPAMSGGAVIGRGNKLIGFCSSSDQPYQPDVAGWAGFVNMAGYLLDMDVDVPGPNGRIVPPPVAKAMLLGGMPLEVDEASFQFDENGQAEYLFPGSPSTNESVR